MTVAELIQFLQKQPQDLQVVSIMYSEQSVLEASNIKIEDLCIARPDGWVENYRKDKPTQKYLVFPGN